MTHTNSQPHEVIDFWQAAGPARWFAKDEDFDRVFRERFMDAHFQAARRELDGWAADAQGLLALLLLLDQYPRNAFRGSAHMYATDPLALHFARRLVDSGGDAQLPPSLRPFAYLPFEHAEDLAEQERAVALCTALGDPYLYHAIEHRDIIARFGRFPHRNAILLRESTSEELAFLAAGGFAG